MATTINKVKKTMNQIIDKLSTQAIIKDFHEYTEIPINTIKENITNYHILSNQEWENIPSVDYDKKAEKFYNSSQFYIYDLISSNLKSHSVVEKLNSFNPLIIETIKARTTKTFLEFGGGLGVFCQLVAKWNKSVTYYDIPGLVSDFAQWRFKKYQLPIEVIISDPTSPPKITNKYDVIFTDAVLEHVINPEENVAVLCKHINHNGKFILLVDLEGGKEYSMHQKIDIKKLHSIIKTHNLLNISGENTFCSIWLKK